MSDHEDLLGYWFGDPDDARDLESRRRLWFQSSPEQDAELRTRFGSLHAQAESGLLDRWRQEARGSLALIILLDQLTRNLYRGTPDAFRNDLEALKVSDRGISHGFDGELHVVERTFFYLPFEHSEQLVHQQRCLELFETLHDQSPPEHRGFVLNCCEYARAHHDIIARFGRYPHRNRALGREHTEAEKSFLAEGGVSFGQG